MTIYSINEYDQKARKERILYKFDPIFIQLFVSSLKISFKVCLEHSIIDLATNENVKKKNVSPCACGGEKKMITIKHFLYTN